MAASKRKAPAKTAESPASKKARVGKTAVIKEPAEEDLPTRPRRKSVGTPQYNFTRPHKPYKKQANKSLPAEDADRPDLDPPKRRGRGRPPGVSNASSKTGNVTTTQKLVSRRVAAKETASMPISKKATTKGTEDEPVGRKRGRPRKLDGASTGKQEPAKKTAAAKKPSPSKTTKSPAKVPKAVSKGNAVPRKRGRPSKVATSQAVTTVQTINAQDISATDTDGEATDTEEQGDRQYWLMKAEPLDRFENGVNVKFSIDDLAAADAPEPWDGVRNYSARNNMRAMRQNDLTFFYHSNCPLPGIVGVMRIAQEHTPDRSAFDPNHPYYDPKSDPNNPKWDCVHVEFVKKFDNQVTLKMLQENKTRGGELADMQLLRMGRLSVSAVKVKEWSFILEMAGEDVHVGEEKSEGVKGIVDGYESDTDGEVNGGPPEELNGDIAAASVTVGGENGEMATESEIKNSTAE